MKHLNYFVAALSLCLGACTARPPATAVLNTPTSPPSLTTFPALTPTITSSPTQTPAATTTQTLTATTTQTLTPSPTPLPSKVVIISIDGLRPDALFQTSAPNFLTLAQSGAYSWQAQTIFPPVTLPSHASMLCGCPVATHGLTWNDYRPNAGTITVPTIFSVAHAAGRRTVMVVSKEKFAHLNTPGDVDSYTFALAGDQDVADQAIAQAQVGFDVMFVHFPNMDYFGHLYGWMSDRYLNALTRTDEAVGRLLAALPAQTTVIVTSDHGGLGFVHGANRPEDMIIPWIIAGPGVRVNYELTGLITTTQTGATALYVLGLELPAEMVDGPVVEAFESTK